MKYFTSFFSGMLLCSVLFGQKDLKNIDSRIKGEFQQVIRLFDGTLGAVLVKNGRGSLLRVGPDDLSVLDTLSTEDGSIEHVVQHPDGGFVFIGTGNNMVKGIGKIDPSANFRWFDNSIFKSVKDFKGLSMYGDSSIIVAGTLHTGVGFACKYNMVNGGRKLEKIAIPSGGTLVSCLIKPNGDIFFVGNYSQKSKYKEDNPNAAAAWIIPFSFDEKTIWPSSPLKIEATGDYSSVRAAALSNDGNIILGGECSEKGKHVDFWVAKINTISAAESWRAYHGGYEKDYCTAISPLRDGNLLLAGYSLSMPSRDITKGAVRVYHVDGKNGENLNNDFFEDQNNYDETVNTILALPRGGVLYAGKKSLDNRDAMLCVDPNFFPFNSDDFFKREANIDYKLDVKEPDGLLKPGMRSYLTLELTNKESIPLANLYLKIEPKTTDQKQPSLWNNLVIEALYPNEPRKVYVPFSCKDSLDIGTYEYQVSIYSGEYKVKSFAIKLKTVKTKTPYYVEKTQLVKWEHREDTYTLATYIKNEGKINVNNVFVRYEPTDTLAIPLSYLKTVVPSLGAESSTVIYFSFESPQLRKVGNTSLKLHFFQDNASHSIYTETIDIKDSILNPKGEPASGVPMVSDSRALLFAVNDYTGTFMSSLQNPIKDANAIAQELQNKYGFVVEVVENPSSRQIQEKITEYSDRYENNTSNHFSSDGQLLIFFSGHGLEEFGEGYFLPSSVEKDKLRETALDYSFLRRRINAINCKHILVAIDACYSSLFEGVTMRGGPGFRRPGELDEPQRILANYRNYKSRLFFTSDAREEMTPDKSSFSKKILEGLRMLSTREDFFTSDMLFAGYVQKAFPPSLSGDFGDHDPGGGMFIFFNSEEVFGTAPENKENQWKKTMESNTVTAYQNYLKAYPKDKDYSLIARERIEYLQMLEKDKKAWEYSQQLNTLEGFQTYLKDWPNGAFRTSAQQAIDNIPNTSPKQRD